MNWYLAVLKNYAKFAGRAGRTEFWVFILINLVIEIVLGLIDNKLGLVSSTGYGVFSGIFSLAVFLPSIAVTVRRLHDTNRSGLWYLLIFVPIIGTIALIIFLVQEGHPGMNQYGPSPGSSA